MTVEDKNHLLDLLTQSHSATRMALEGIDLEINVHPESGWRIRDILGHIAAWDHQVARSLRAYHVDEEYAIPNFDEDTFNEQDFLRQQKMTSEQVLEEWEEAREDFKEAVKQIPPDQFPGDLLYPWGNERGTIAHLVKSMIEHDIEHQAEIVQAIQSSK